MHVTSKELKQGEFMKGDSALLLDSHVHFYPCFTWSRFLDAAVSNFANARRRLHLAENTPSCLVLTEGTGFRYFQRLADEPDFLNSFGWRVNRTDEDRSIVLSREQGDRIVIVAGRQIVSAEKLEILGLGLIPELPDGKPIRTILEDVLKSEAVPVIPWGFGKWWGHRGKIVRDLLNAKDSPPFLLGDNGLRLRSVAPPPLFLEARRAGIRVLPGSDPLPFPSEISRVGTFGCVLPDLKGFSRPTEALREFFREWDTEPFPFGTQTALSRFCQLQVAMLYRKYLGRSGH